MVKICFFDTETTGLVPFNGNIYRNYTDLSEYRSCRLIQLGYIIYDSDKKEVVRQNSLYVKPDRFKILNTNIHGITNEICETKGSSLSYVLNIFNDDIKDCEYIVAHNIQFDFAIVFSECHRYELYNIINNIQKLKPLCTIEMAKKAFLIDYKIKLVDLYEICCPKKVWKQHDALEDSKVCMQCFMYLNNKLKIINHL